MKRCLTRVKWAPGVLADADVSLANTCSMGSGTASSMAWISEHHPEQSEAIRILRDNDGRMPRMPLKASMGLDGHNGVTVRAQSRSDRSGVIDAMAPGSALRADLDEGWATDHANGLRLNALGWACCAFGNAFAFAVAFSDAFATIGEGCALGLALAFGTGGALALAFGTGGARDVDKPRNAFAKGALTAGLCNACPGWTQGRVATRVTSCSPSSPKSRTHDLERSANNKTCKKWNLRAPPWASFPRR